MTVERAQVCEVGVEPLEASLPKRNPTLLEGLVASDGCDRSFYGSYAILALPEIFDSARAADIATFITQHEPRPPPVTVDELRAAVAAA